MPQMNSHNSRESVPRRGPDRYEVERPLNSGSFGSVYLGFDKYKKRQVAIKYIPRGDKVNKHVLYEIKNHRNLLHHHVIQFQEIFLQPRYLCIVMEYAPGGDMLEYVKRKNGLTENEARWFFQQLVIGLDYCHKMKVVNRDIKLENTLLDNSEWPLLKICDFGYSKHEDFNSAPMSRVGTPAYLAPEVIQNSVGNHYDGKISDVWSCGVFLYVMLVGAYPFDHPEDRKSSNKLSKMIQRILNNDIRHPNHVKLSRNCWSLITRILESDPEKRFTLQEIMEHPWFLKMLPEGAIDMNNQIQHQKAGLQTDEEIEEIWEKAKYKDESHIDDAIDSELDNF